MPTFNNKNVRTDADDSRLYHNKWTYFRAQTFLLCSEKFNNSFTPPLTPEIFTCQCFSSFSNIFCTVLATHPCVLLWWYMSLACAEKWHLALAWAYAASWQVASNKHCANSLGICGSQIWKRHLVIIWHQETDWKGQFVFNQQCRLAGKGSNLNLIWWWIKWCFFSDVISENESINVWFSYVFHAR